MTDMETNGLDAYYTPASLAIHLAAAIPESTEGIILDPTVGNGALLKAVSNRFGGRVTPVGIDIDARTVRELRSQEPTWSLSIADVLSPRSRNSSSVWRRAKVDVSAVVLNPPFSYRGNGGRLVSYGAFSGRVGPSMEFLIEAVKELRPKHGFYAILPDGALASERHVPLWRELESEFFVERIESFDARSFSPATVHTWLIRLTRRDRSIFVDADGVGVFAAESSFSKPMSAKGLASQVDGCRCVEVVRGRVPVHQVENYSDLNSRAAYLHTTSVWGKDRVGDRAAPSVLADRSPFLVLPRVGRWNTPVRFSYGLFVLSDCLFALRPRDFAALDELEADLVVASSAFASRFRGTAARYITLTDVTGLLSGIGWHPHVMKAGSDLGSCCGSCGQ